AEGPGLPMEAPAAAEQTALPHFPAALKPASAEPLKPAAQQPALRMGFRPAPAIPLPEPVEITEHGTRSTPQPPLTHHALVAPKSDEGGSHITPPPAAAPAPVTRHPSPPDPVPLLHVPLRLVG